MEAVLTALGGAEALAARGVYFVFEPIHVWRAGGADSPLQRMYDGRMSFFDFQVLAVTTLFGLHNSSLAMRNARVIVTERSLVSNLEIFGRCNLDGTALSDFMLVYNALRDTLPPRREAYIYLRLGADVASQRVRARGRPEEAGRAQSGAFQEHIVSLHETLAARHDLDVIPVDAEADVATVTERVMRIISLAIAATPVLEAASARSEEGAAGGSRGEHDAASVLLAPPAMDIESGPHEQDVQAILPASADAIMTEREPQEPNEQWAHARWSHDFMLDEPPHSRRRWLGEYVARLLRHTYAR